MNKKRRIVNKTVTTSESEPDFPVAGSVVNPMVFAGDFTGAQVGGMEWSAVNGAGTNPTLDGKLQHSRNGVTWFDVDATNVKFTQATSGTATQFVPIPDGKQLMPFLRIQFTIGGTDTPSYTVQVWIWYNQWGAKGRLAPPGYINKLD
jgi:hypothetical protein